MQCKCGGYAHLSTTVYTDREAAMKVCNQRISFLPVQVNRTLCNDCGRDITTISKPNVLDGQPVKVKGIGLLGKMML